MLCDFRGGRRARGSVQQLPAGRLLELLFHSCDQRNAFFEEVAACLTGRCIEAHDCATGAHGLLEVRLNEVQPVAPRRALQLHRVRAQGRLEFLLALGDDGGDLEIAAHRIDRHSELRQ